MASETLPVSTPAARRDSEIKRVAANLEAKVAELRAAVAEWQAMVAPPPDHDNGPSMAGRSLT